MKIRVIKSRDKGDALALTFDSTSAALAGSTSFMGYNFKKPIKSKLLRVG